MPVFDYRATLFETFQNSRKTAAQQQNNASSLMVPPAWHRRPTARRGPCAATGV